MKFTKIFWVGLFLAQGNLFSMQAQHKIPLVYHDGYKFDYKSLPGFENIPVEQDRHLKIFNSLLSAGVGPERFYQPGKPLDAYFEQIHTQGYLKSLQEPKMIGAYFKNPQLSNVAIELLDDCLIKPQRLAAGGTVLACRLALKNGWAINLGGGFNLAMPDACSGWSLFSDVGLAIYKLWHEDPFKNILIVDLCAIQSDAYAKIFQCYGDPQMINVNVHLFQMYNSEKFKSSDPLLSGLIQLNLQLRSDISGSEYKRLLGNALSDIIKTTQPSLIIYIAGTDTFKGDKLGGMTELTEQDIIERDELVFLLAEVFNKPIAMILGSGYSDQSSTIASHSIQNILRIKGVLK